MLVFYLSISSTKKKQTKKIEHFFKKRKNQNFRFECSRRFETHEQRRDEARRFAAARGDASPQIGPQRAPLDERRDEHQRCRLHIVGLCSLRVGQQRQNKRSHSSTSQEKQQQRASNICLSDCSHETLTFVNRVIWCSNHRQHQIQHKRPQNNSHSKQRR